MSDENKECIEETIPHDTGGVPNYIVNLPDLEDTIKQAIKNAFLPISQRNRLPLEQEIEQADRINFERVLLEIFGIAEHYDAIKASLIHLYKIRFAVKD